VHGKHFHIRSGYKSEINRCIEMALEFPHVEVLGIDLEPRQIREPPSNCSFVRHDIDLGLSQFYGKYDFIHCRYAGHGVSTE
jgi:hypothetical protein